MQRLVPHVDGVFGTRELRALGDELAAWRGEFGDDELTVDRELETRDRRQRRRRRRAPTTRCAAFVNVQRGCSYYCTFCIVPHVRGRFDHRPMARDPRRSAAQGRGRRARDHARRPDRQRVPRARDRRGLRRPARRSVARSRASSGSRSSRSHPKDLTDKLARVVRDAAEDEPALPPRGAVGLEPDAAPHEPQVHDRGVPRARRDVSSAQPELGDHDRHHRRLSRRDRSGFPADARLCATGMFAQAYMFVYSPRRGTPAACGTRRTRSPPEVARSASRGSSRCRTRTCAPITTARSARRCAR